MVRTLFGGFVSLRRQYEYRRNGGGGEAAVHLVEFIDCVAELFLNITHALKRAS